MTTHNHDVLMAVNSRIINGRSGGAKQLNADYKALVKARDEIIKLREALAEQPAQQALDKMAENARELGLDYEPVWGGGPSNKDYEDAMRLRRLNELAKPAQRKPLTDEEIKDVAASCMWWVREQDILDDAIELARAIEAAHGIKKNT